MWEYKYSNIPVDVPVPEVPVGRVLYVPDVGAHDLPGDVLLGLDASLQHRHLQLTQHLQPQDQLIKSTQRHNSYKEG